MFEIKLDSKTTVCFLGLMERFEQSIKEVELGAIEEGSFERRATQVCKKMKLGQSLEKIAEDLVEEVSVIGLIYNMARKYGPESVMEKLAETEQIGEAREKAEDKAEDKAKGNLRRLVIQVCKKMKLGQPLEKIAEDLVEEVSVIEPIYNMVGKCGPEHDPEYEPESVMEKLAAAGQGQEKE